MRKARELIEIHPDAPELIERGVIERAILPDHHPAGQHQRARVFRSAQPGGNAACLFDPDALGGGQPYGERFAAPVIGLLGGKQARSRSLKFRARLPRPGESFCETKTYLATLLTVAPAP